MSEPSGGEVFAAFTKAALEYVYEDEREMAERMSVSRVQVNRWRHGKGPPNPVGLRAVFRRVMQDAKAKGVKVEVDK